MLYRHVFDKISTEFRGILRVFVNFAAFRRREISEALTTSCIILYKLATKNLHLATTFLQLVAKRRPEDFFNFEPCMTENLRLIFPRINGPIKFRDSSVLKFIIFLKGQNFFKFSEKLEQALKLYLKSTF